MSRKEKLIAGYKAFRAGDYIGQKKLYEKLGTKGQSPNVMLIACSDSRVDPTDIFDAYPGEMFVTRNVTTGPDGAIYVALPNRIVRLSPPQN